MPTMILLCKAAPASLDQATVFKAHDPGIGRDVAIKFLHASLCEDEGCRVRFLRAAGAAATALMGSRRAHAPDAPGLGAVQLRGTDASAAATAGRHARSTSGAFGLIEPYRCPAALVVARFAAWPRPHLHATGMTFGAFSARRLS